MTVLIPHPTEELIFAKLQKELITELFEDGRIMYAVKPLWVEVGGGFDTASGLLNHRGDEISFADVTLNSRDLTTNLTGCTKVALLAATIGPQVDALIRRHSTVNPVYASILQATGAMFIEEVVDLVNDEIKKIAASQGLKTKPRYSPGFGDVPLEVQKDFFRLLPCTRIGLTLMDTLIMAPEKSVTAFVGLF